MYRRKTKLVVTVGPAIQTPERLEQLIVMGVDVFRLNFSHGLPQSHRDCVQLLRRYSDQLNRPIGIIGDLQGPKIRVGQFLSGSVVLSKDSSFTLHCSQTPKVGDQMGAWVDYPALIDQVAPQEILLLNDGAIRLMVEKIEGERIICRTLVGGVLSDHKGVNKLGGGINAPVVTEKDKRDMELAVQLSVDYLAISFVKSGQDLAVARKIASDLGFRGKLMAKVERAEAVRSESAMVELVQAADAIMVARGDLAVEIGDEALPFVQKQLIATAKRQGKPVITATQMLESMIRQPFPTRAEVLDVANAVLDGTDAIMLSAESATGAYPLESVAKAIDICLGVENPSNYHSELFSFALNFPKFQLEQESDLALALVNGAAAMVQACRAIKLCTVFTASGKTAALLSSLLGNIPIMVFTTSPETCRQCKLLRCVHPMVLAKDTVQDAASLMTLLQKQGCVEPNDIVLCVRGDRLYTEGSSNACQLLRILPMT